MEYEVLNTLSGDYTGDLIIKKENDNYKSEITSKGVSYDVAINVLEKDSISIFSNVEGFLTTINGKINSTKINADVFVVGDPNIYTFTAKRKTNEQILKIVDSNSNEAISYANIVYGNEGTITNEKGFCKIKIQSPESILIISAIGYLTDTIQIKKESQLEVIHLKASKYTLPVVEVRAKGLSAKKIVEAAINRFGENYIQKPYNANLFYRHSALNSKDSLVYQSESMMKFYDSEGYQKGNWRNAAHTRFARLEQGRITVGKQKETLELRELDNIFVFWSHEPIITDDKPLSTKSINAYDYKFIGIEEFQEKEVYVIEFFCKKLKIRFAGLPSLKYMHGTLYINKEDYAILKYEQQYLMDYEFRGKHPKKRGHLSERSIIENSRIEIFSKYEEGYFLDYSKTTSSNDRLTTMLNGETKVFENTIIQEHQYLNITTDDIELLDKNLFDIENNTLYNPGYWSQFNVILNSE